MIEQLAAMLASERSVGEVMVISFDHPSLHRVKQRIPGVRTEVITHARHIDPVGLARRADAACG